jgi:hypothetical protein
VKLSEVVGLGIKLSPVATMDRNDPIGLWKCGTDITQDLQVAPPSNVLSYRFNRS